MPSPRQAFGLPALDRQLGGGLLPGTLTAIAGATGAGKTQLGLRWAAHGLEAEGRRGVVLDLSSRGDSQNHADYARDQLGWDLNTYPADVPIDPAAIWDQARDFAEHYHPFARAGRRVTRDDLGPEAWHAWKSDLGRTLRAAAAYFYAQLTRGVRRVIVDGVEPADRMSESIQFEFFEYLYHQVLRKEHDWAAREVLRETYRANLEAVMAHRYDPATVGCLYLATTGEVMLDDLMSRPIGEGDIFANANTIILMGRVKSDKGLGRGLFVAKHRGSRCGDEVLPFHMTDRGPDFDPISE